MAALYVYFVLLVVSVDAAHGEIPNEIQQFVLSLLQKHDGEVMELKQEIRTLRQEVSSLQRSFLKVLNELDDTRRKENKEVSVPMKTEMHDKIRKQPSKNLSPQNVTKFNASQNSTGYQLLPQNVKHTRKGRLVPHHMIGNYPAAYSAAMSINPSNLRHNQVLVFDSLIFNSGNVYDKTSGIFTPNSKGVYVLFSTITTTPGKSLEAEIVRNGNVLCRIYAGNRDLYSPGSNMAVSALDIGDRVLVRIHDHFHEGGVTIDGAFSTFSGYLLYEID